MIRRAALLCFMCFFFGIGAVRAQGLSLIRDEEIERGIASYLIPLFDKAGLDSQNMSLHLVKDDSINAFAAQGLHVFIHTGLLLKADNAQEVIAVLAHETGHIAGGHIARLYENIRIAQRNMLISMILGSVAAAASGRGDVAVAAAMGGMSSAQGLLAGYRRTEENAADQVAIDLLIKTNHDFSGFESIMRKLERQESYLIDDAAILWRTHPMVKERLNFILNQQKESLQSRMKPDYKKIASENTLFERLQAKLHAFIYSPKRTLERYPESNKSLPARYARSIVAYQQGNFESALTQVDALIKEYPKDPYFYELKGQILFETGRAAEAVGPYQKAVELLPDSVLLRIGLAQAQIEKDSDESLQNALETLAAFARSDAEIPLIWRLQAIVYGRTGQRPMASYALAEYNYLIGDAKQAEFFAKQAVEQLPEGMPAQLRAEDILKNIKSQKSQKRR